MRRRLEKTILPHLDFPLFPERGMLGGEGKRKWSNGVLSPAGTRGFLAGNGDTGSFFLVFASAIRFRCGGEEGRDIDGGKTIGHWHVINAIYARTISWTGTVVFVLPACAPFIKRGEN